MLILLGIVTMIVNLLPLIHCGCSTDIGILKKRTTRFWTSVKSHISVCLCFHSPFCSAGSYVCDLPFSCAVLDIWPFRKDKLIVCWHLYSNLCTVVGWVNSTWPLYFQRVQSSGRSFLVVNHSPSNLIIWYAELSCNKNYSIRYRMCWNIYHIQRRKI